MGALATIRAFGALSKDQKRFLWSKRLEGDFTPGQWLELLRGLAEYDAAADRQRSKMGALVFGAVIFVIGTIFLYPPLLALSIPLFAVLVLMLVINRRMDVIHLREFILPLVTLLGDDVKKGRTLQLRIDLRGAVRKDKLVEKKPPYVPPGFRKVVETVYVDPWLSGDAVLSDGARLQLRISDQVRKLRRTRKTARGKIKIKTKYKVKELVEINLKLPAERYRIAALEQAAVHSAMTQPFRFKAGSGEKWHTLAARRILRRGDLKQPAKLEPVLEMLTRLYGGAETIAEGGAAHA